MKNTQGVKSCDWSHSVLLCVKHERIGTLPRHFQKMHCEAPLVHNRSLQVWRRFGFEVWQLFDFIGR